MSERYARWKYLRDEKKLEPKHALTALRTGDAEAAAFKQMAEIILSFEPIPTAWAIAGQPPRKQHCGKTLTIPAQWPSHLKLDKPAWCTVCRSWIETQQKRTKS